MVRLLAGMIRVTQCMPRRARTPGLQRVLFLRPDRIGDMVVSTGVIHAIGTTPDVLLDVLAAPANAPVLDFEPAVRDVLVLNRRDRTSWWQLVREMRRREYDVVVDCMPTAPSVTILLLLMASGARRCVGTRGRGLDHILSPATRALPLDTHIVDHVSCLVDAFRTDASSLDLRPRLVLTEAEDAHAERLWQSRSTHRPADDGVVVRDGYGVERRTRVLVNISAGKRSRRWPLERYAQVVDAARALDPGLQLLLMAAPHEQDRVRELAQRTGGTVVETRTLREAFALVSRADLLFTPDTSIAHAAVAFRVPTVDMLLVGKASGWGLYHSPGINLESPDESLMSLDAEVASDAVQAVLREVLRARYGGHTQQPLAMAST
jgi:ADP-heptose:LPS heptosyltransferase